MSNNLFDPKMYKHVHSDDKTTTLKHKRGHTIRISHNAISPKMRTALQALSKIPQEDATADQAQESQDQHQYGKVIMKADGGVMENDPTKAYAVANVERGDDQPSQPSSNSRPMATRPSRASSYGDESWPSPSQTSVGKGYAGGGYVENKAPGSTSSGAYDAGLPCLNPNCKSHGRPHPNCRCYPGLAEGGEVSKLRYCAHGKPHQDDCEYANGGKVESNDHLASGHKQGVSTQGEDVRAQLERAYPFESTSHMRERLPYHKNAAKEEAKGRADMERHIKPKMQKLADGGPAVPYGMRQEDIPQGQPQIQPQAQDIPAPEQPSMMLKEGMPGYEESKKPQAEDDDGGKTDQAMYDKIHGGDQYGRTPAAQPQPQAQPIANDPGADTVQPGSDTVEMAQPQPDIPQPIDHKQAILQEDQAFQQDLMNGHITPKTYGDLMYHNKDGSEKSTLGKIGSIFGLMLSSIGSGLTHGPNLSMQMMDNAIKQDLDAQMKSKDNAQNFIKLNQQRLLNEAEIPKLVAEGKLTTAQAQLADTQAGKLSYELSNMQVNRAALHKMANEVNMLPPGPQRQQAMAALAMVSDKVDSENFNIADRAAAKQAMLQSVVSGSLLGNQAGNSNVSSNKDQTRAMRMVGDEKLGKEADVMEKRRMGGIEGEASRDIDGKDRDAMEKHQQLNANLQDLKQNLAKLTTINHLSPAYTTLVGKISKLQSDIRSSQLGTVYKPSEQQLLDATLKIPASQLTEYQTRSQVDQLLDSNNRDFNTLKKSYDLPVYRTGKDGKRYQETTIKGKSYLIPVK